MIKILLDYMVMKNRKNIQSLAQIVNFFCGEYTQGFDFVGNDVVLEFNQIHLFMKIVQYFPTFVEVKRLFINVGIIFTMKIL